MCYNLEILPNSFTVGLPATHARPSFYSSHSSLRYSLSMETTQALLLEYSRFVSFLLSLLCIISFAFPHLILPIHVTLLLAFQPSSGRVAPSPSTCYPTLLVPHSFLPTIPALPLFLSFPQPFTFQLPSSPNFNLLCQHRPHAYQSDLFRG